MLWIDNIFEETLFICWWRRYLLQSLSIFVHFKWIFLKYVRYERREFYHQRFLHQDWECRWLCSNPNLRVFNYRAYWVGRIENYSPFADNTYAFNTLVCWWFAPCFMIYGHFVIFWHYHSSTESSHELFLSPVSRDLSSNLMCSPIINIFTIVTLLRWHPKIDWFIPWSVSWQVLRSSSFVLRLRLLRHIAT